MIGNSAAIVPPIAATIHIKRGSRHPSRWGDAPNTYDQSLCEPPQHEGTNDENRARPTELRIGRNQAHPSSSNQTKNGPGDEAEHCASDDS
jgi:hypothetical protein